MTKKRKPIAKFAVDEVFDGDTFKVRNPWFLVGKTGDVVRPAGYNTPEKGEKGYEEAKRKLERLILNKKVEIRNFRAVGRWERLIADVYYKGKNLADYFPEYKV